LRCLRSATPGPKIRSTRTLPFARGRAGGTCGHLPTYFYRDQTVSRKTIIFAGTLSIVGALVLVLVSAIFCRATLQKYPRLASPPPNSTTVTVTAHNGANLSAWWLQPPRPKGNCVAVLHGIGDLRLSRSTLPRCNRSSRPSLRSVHTLSCERSPNIALGKGFACPWSWPKVHRARQRRFYSSMSFRIFALHRTNQCGSPKPILANLLWLVPLTKMPRRHGRRKQAETPILQSSGESLSSIVSPQKRVIAEIAPITRPNVWRTTCKARHRDRIQAAPPLGRSTRRSTE
jgi:hypothetical protein